MMIRRFWHDGGKIHSEVIPTINITRKERASIAFQKSRERTKEEVVAFERGYEAAECDFEMIAMGMGPNYGSRP